MKFEYIASGLSFPFVTWSDKILDEVSKNTIQSLLSSLSSQFKYHSFGVLYNGYTEQGIAPKISNIFKPYTIQVDSGGLQMINLGRTITEEGKDKVYENQASYGSIGMSFDVMPLKLPSGKSEFLKTNTRFFDPDMLVPCATESGKNLARQIEVYLKMKTECKPMLIIQGDSLESYQKWLDVCLNQVPKEHWGLIKGISCGSGALGAGLQEDAERIFILSQLQGPKHLLKHFHLLGFGSMNRLITAIQMSKTNLFEDDVLISYDSTKHTGGVMRGQYQLNQSMVQMSRDKDEMYYKVLKDITKNCKDVFDYEFNEEIFHDTIVKTASFWNEKYGDSSVELERERNITRFIFLVSGVLNLMRYVDNMMKDERLIAKLRKKDHNALITLKHVNDKKDFDEWMKVAGRHLISKRVGNYHEKSCLSNFL